MIAILRINSSLKVNFMDDSLIFFFTWWEKSGGARQLCMFYYILSFHANKTSVEKLICFTAPLQRQHLVTKIQSW